MGRPMVKWEGDIETYADEDEEEAGEDEADVDADKCPALADMGMDRGTPSDDNFDCEELDIRLTLSSLSLFNFNDLS